MTGTTSYVYRRENNSVNGYPADRGAKIIQRLARAEVGGLSPRRGSPDRSWNLWVCACGCLGQMEVNHCWTAHPSRGEENTQPFPSSPHLPPAPCMCQTKQEASWLRISGNSACPCTEAREEWREGLRSQAQNQHSQIPDTMAIYWHTHLWQIINNIVKFKKKKQQHLTVKLGANLDSASSQPCDSRQVILLLNLSSWIVRKENK